MKFNFEKVKEKIDDYIEEVELKDLSKKKEWKDFTDEEKEKVIKDNFPFPKIRNIQLETIKIILDKFLVENIKDVIMELPTGSGKSGIAKTIANIMQNELDTRNTFLTSSKTLQEQYVNDFPDLVNISNSIDYPCALTTATGEARDYHYNDENCKKHSVKWCREKCPYILTTKEWRNANQRVTNYHFYGMYQQKGKDKKIDVLIMDEVHNLPNITVSIAEITFNLYVLNSLKNVIEKGLNSLKLFGGFNYSYNFEIIDDIIELVNALYNAKNSDGLINLEKEMVNQFLYIKTYLIESNKTINEQINKLKEKDVQLPDEVFKMMEILSKLEFYFNILTYGGYFYIEKRNNEVLIKPFDAKAANILYFNKAKYRLYLSATIGDIKTFTKELGINKYYFKSYESIFKKENRPIYYLPVCNFTYRNREEAINQIGMFLNELLNQYENEKGVIFVSSYRDAEDILAKLNPELQQRCKIPKDTTEVRELLRTENYDIIISPIMFEGADLKDDKARFAVLCKIPYLSLADNYTKVKLKYNKEWYNHNTMLKIIQSYGRGVRHEEDKCDYFVIDSNFEKFKNKLPKWIKEAIEE